jgi:RHS repeat-associated protein
MFVSKGDGAIVGRASYRGFGTHTVTGQLGERSFAGGFEVSGLGLVVLGPRVLDSDTGRFLSQDPVFNAVNLYAYAQGNPVFFWDPSGTITATQSIAATAAAQLGGDIAVVGLAFQASPVQVKLAFGLGAVAGLALYNFIAIAVDPDGSSRVTRDTAFQFLRDLYTYPVVTPTGGGGVGDGSYSPGAYGPGDPFYLPPPPPPIDCHAGDPCSQGPGGGNGTPVGLDGFLGGGLTFSIATSFAGAFW